MLPNMLAVGTDLSGLALCIAVSIGAAVLMASVSDLTEVFRYRYFTPERIRYLFNEESVFYRILTKKKQRVDGRSASGRGQAIVPILTQNPTGFRGIVEGGTLPTPRQPKSDEATFGLQEFVGMYNVSWRLIQDSMRSVAAFERAVKLLAAGLERHILRMLNADMLSDGRGVLAKLPAADDEVEFTVDRPSLAEVGMLIDMMDDGDDDTLHLTAKAVTGNDPVARTVTTGTAVTSSGPNDYIVIATTTDVSVNGALHMDGILGVVDDDNPRAVVGNYGGIDRGAVGKEFWKAIVLENNGNLRDLDEDLILSARRQQRIKGGGRTQAILSNDAIVQRYHEMLANQRFFSFGSPAQKIAGGVGPKGFGDGPKSDGRTVYDFGGVAWHTDPYFEPNTIVGLDLRTVWFGHGANSEPQPISEIFDNIPFFRQTTNATFEVAWYIQCNVLSDNPAANWKIEDVSEA